MPQPASTTIDPRLIQRVVREVVLRLRQQPSGTGGAPQAHSDTSPAKPDADGPLRIDQRLITVETLNVLPSGCRGVVVPARAVITPAAKDEAKQRGVQIQCVDRERQDPTAERTSGSAGQSSSRVRIADADDAARGQGLAAQLLSRGRAVRSGTVDEALAEVAGSPNQVAVILSNEPAAIVCRACRSERVRAAAIDSHQQLERVSIALRPNVWVLDMQRISIPQAAALADRCARSAAEATAAEGVR